MNKLTAENLARAAAQAAKIVAQLTTDGKKPRFATHGR